MAHPRPRAPRVHATRSCADLHRKASCSRSPGGAAYHGTVSVSGIVTCGGADVTSTFTVGLHATDAGAVRDRWVVTKVQGTMTQSESAQLGCIGVGRHVLGARFVGPVRRIGWLVAMPGWLAVARRRG